MSLGRNKGCGRDGLPVEVLLAGGEALYAPVATLYNRLTALEDWPVAWTGGRMQEVHKKKGALDDCDEYRGIVLEDHLAKGYKQWLSSRVMGCYASGMPDSQHGAVPGRSTDFATHLVRSFLDHARRLRRSVFVIFIDLVKAFDRAVREVTLGWPAGVTDGAAYLRGLGIDRESADFIAAWVAQHGCLFEKWGVDPKTIRLLKNMHAASWFSYGSVDEAIATRLGGRQGCKYGAAIFNSGFSLALVLLREALEEAGIVLRVDRCDGAFWGERTDADGGPEPGRGPHGACPGGGGVTATPAGGRPAPDAQQPSTPGDGRHADREVVIDAAFVDDAVLMIMALTADALDRAIDALLTPLCRIYRLLHMTINWKAGKTEALLVYRGPGAAGRLHARRPAPGEPPSIPVPGCDLRLLVVHAYKHLGGEIRADGCVIDVAQGHRRAALGAYCPLATKVVGAAGIDLQLKLSLLHSLVMSRLTFNLHVLVPTVRFLSVLNDVYMRVEAHPRRVPARPHRHRPGCSGGRGRALDRLPAVPAASALPKPPCSQPAACPACIAGHQAPWAFAPLG